MDKNQNAWVSGVITKEQKGEGQIDKTLCDHLPRHCLMSSQSTPLVILASTSGVIDWILDTVTVGLGRIIFGWLA